MASRTLRGGAAAAVLFDPCTSAHSIIDICYMAADHDHVLLAAADDGYNTAGVPQHFCFDFALIAEEKPESGDAMRQTNDIGTAANIFDDDFCQIIIFIHKYTPCLRSIGAVFLQGQFKHKKKSPGEQKALHPGLLGFKGSELVCLLQGIVSRIFVFSTNQKGNIQIACGDQQNLDPFRGQSIQRP